MDHVNVAIPDTYQIRDSHKKDSFKTEMVHFI